MLASQNVYREDSHIVCKSLHLQHFLLNESVFSVSQVHRRRVKGCDGHVTARGRLTVDFPRAVSGVSLSPTVKYLAER